MKLIPAFDLGFFNAWMLTFPWLLVNYVPAFFLLNKESGVYQWPPYKRVQRWALNLWTAIIAAMAFYSLFLPLEVDTPYFIPGLVIYVTGLGIQISAYTTSARTPSDRVVTGGIYRFSRNPMGISLLLVPVGIGIASLSWVFIASGVAIILLINVTLSAEETMCKERFGESYQEYLEKTPKWIGFPGRE